MFPDQTIEDLKIDAMHDALERARASLREQSKRLDVRNFSIRLSKPHERKRAEGDHALKFDCYAEITIRSTLTV